MNCVCLFWGHPLPTLNHGALEQMQTVSHLRGLVLGCVLRDAGFGQEVSAEEASTSLRPPGAVA